MTDAAGTQDAAGAEQAAQRAVARARAAVRGGRGPGAGAAEVLRQRHRDDFRMATVGRGPVGHHAGVGGSSRAEEVPALDADLAHVAPPPCADGVAQGGPTVADVMISRPKALPVHASVADVRVLLADDHVVMALLTDDGVLRGTLLREDLPATAPGAAPALPLARLTGRTAAPTAPLADVHALLLHTGRRRLAVVDGAGRLLGLLCLTRRRTGYCSDAGVAERARSRRCAPEAPAPTR